MNFFKNKERVLLSVSGAEIEEGVGKSLLSVFPLPDQAAVRLSIIEIKNKDIPIRALMEFLQFARSVKEAGGKLTLIGPPDIIEDITNLNPGEIFHSLEKEEASNVH